MVREKTPKSEWLGDLVCAMKKALVCALEMIQEWEPESVRMLAAAWKVQKALVWANETVRDYAPKLERVVSCYVDGDEGTSVGDKAIQEVGARSFDRMLAS